MKFKKSLFGLLAFLAVSTTFLSGCSGNNKPEVKPGPDDTTNPDKPGGDEGNKEPTKFIDYVHTAEHVRLKNDYKKPDGTNRNFYEDGISEVTLWSAIDGDTSHFKIKGYDDADIVQSRYYGIDTPESTGDVQPWGKAASKFTKSKLESAKTIVITSESLDYKEPIHDSTGNRYTTMVWISEEANADYKDLVLLNLWIVQEGYSYVKGLAKFPEFKDVFIDAEFQARELKLHVFSEEPDPNFNYGEYETVSLFTIQQAVKDQIEGKIDENPFDNKKVRIEGTVAGYTNNILFLQAKRINEETGEEEFAGINIFTGMGSVDSYYSSINTRLQLCGLCVDSEEFGFQLSAVHGGFPFMETDDPDGVKVLSEPDETIKQGLEVKEFKVESNVLKKNFKYVNSPVIVDEIFEVTKGFDPNQSSKRGGTLKLKRADGSFPPYDVFVTFAFFPNKGATDGSEFDRWNKATDYVGHKFKFKGIYTVRKTRSGSYSYQITPRDVDDIELIKN